MLASEKKSPISYGMDEPQRLSQVRCVCLRESILSRSDV